MVTELVAGPNGIACDRVAGLLYPIVKVTGGPVGALSALADAVGFLHNDGAGVLAWSPEVGPDHALLSALHTDSLAAAVARGSIIYGNATPKWAAMAVGAAGALLTADGTDVAWSVSPQIGAAAAGGTLTVNPTLGPELLTNGGFDTDLTGWTPGAVWQWASGTAQKFQDGTSTLAHTAATCVVGSWYKLVFTISNWTVGTVYATVGGMVTPPVGANGTYTRYIRAATTAAPIFTPTSTSRFSIDDVSLKLCTLGEITARNLYANGEIGLVGQGATESVRMRLGSVAEANYHMLALVNNAGENKIYLSTYRIDVNGAMLGASMLSVSTWLYGSVSILGLASTAALSWSATTTASATKDLGISRLSAGVGAVGNGSVGDFSGGLKMTTFGLGVTPVGVQTGCAIPTDLASCITAITALRAALNAFGLTTVV